MYRVEKVLNHNAVIAIHVDNHKEYLIMGKGVGFGKKVNERMEARPEDTVNRVYCPAYSFRTGGWKCFSGNAYGTGGKNLYFDGREGSREGNRCFIPVL